MNLVKNRAALSVVLCLLAVTFGRKQRLTADDDVKRLKLSFEDAEKWAENDPFMLTCLEAKTNMKKWCSNSKLYNKFCKVQKHRNKVVYQRAIGAWVFRRFGSCAKKSSSKKKFVCVFLIFFATFSENPCDARLRQMPVPLLERPQRQNLLQHKNQNASRSHLRDWSYLEV